MLQGWRVLQPNLRSKSQLNGTFFQESFRVTNLCKLDSNVWIQMSEKPWILLVNLGQSFTCTPSIQPTYQGIVRIKKDNFLGLPDDKEKIKYVLRVGQFLEKERS